MGKRATVIELTEAERASLESRLRRATTQHRYVLRAQIVLAAAGGESSDGIAQRLGVRRATVSRWRTRFARDRLAGLEDRPRPGQPRKYDQTTDQRVLALLDESPPAGHSRWTGTLLAAALGAVPADQVWRILRRLGISLRQTKSWCVSTDPDFTSKAADIVGLYLNPPEQAVVLCMDEKPSIQALQRAQGWLRLPNGKALTGASHEYQRNGTTTLFAALEVATGQVRAGHYHRRRRREFLDFMNDLIALYEPGTELHVILDNLSTHKPKRDRWLACHPRVHFHYTPTHASWLNQIEIWFSKLSRAALQGASFASVRELRQAIADFIAAHNCTAQPFEWRKADVRPQPLQAKYADLRK
jgi:transposase